MFKSVRRWACVPFEVKPYVGRTGGGTKQFGASEQYTCYPSSDTILIKTQQGVEKASKTQLFVDAAVLVKVTDNVVFEGTEYPILHIMSYYNTKGGVDMQVIYL